jgi:hypothetical protein
MLFLRPPIYHKQFKRKQLEECRAGRQSAM